MKTITLILIITMIMIITVIMIMIMNLTLTMSKAKAKTMINKADTVRDHRGQTRNRVYCCTTRYRTACWIVLQLTFALLYRKVCLMRMWLRSHVTAYIAIRCMCVPVCQTACVSARFCAVRLHVHCNTAKPVRTSRELSQHQSGGTTCLTLLV